MPEALVERYPAFAVDLDGVVWRGEALLPGAAQGLAAIREAGKRLLFLTNNGTYTPEWVVGRLRRWGIEASEPEVLTSAAVAAEWIRRHGLHGRRALVVAPLEVVRQLDGLLEIVPIGSDSEASVVLVGRDTGFTFERLAAVSDTVRRGAEFLALNRDATMPLEAGLEPGTGALLAAIEAASGRSALVLGKPEAPMMEAAREILGSAALMIGDRLDSDVAGARKVGWDAALVTSGVTRPEDEMDPAPDWLLTSLADLAGEPAAYHSHP